MRTLIIAEAGVNHNGSINLAKQLIRVAKDSGADVVKFQTFKAETLVTVTAEKAGYQKITTGADESQFDMLRKLELRYEDHQILINYCREVGIAFMSTPFDLESINFLNSLDMPFFKIPSGEITNFPYLQKVGGLGKKVILSTGMSTLDEVEAAIKVLKENGLKHADLTVLHCTSQYPAPFENINLNAIKTMRDHLQCPVGYSDHSLGIEVSLAAVALGATVIEKHFTLDKNLPGPDHKASLEPQELKAMISAIRNIEKALGSDLKTPSAEEKEVAKVARKSLVTKKAIKKGEAFSIENMTTKRPGVGISPMRWKEFIGKESDRDYGPDELIQIS